MDSGNNGGKAPSREVFRFSFSKRTHQDVIDMIESIPRPFRSEYVAKAIRYMAANMEAVFVEKKSHTETVFEQSSIGKQQAEKVDLSKTFKF